jgi:hypothetical protein
LEDGGAYDDDDDDDDDEYDEDDDDELPSRLALTAAADCIIDSPADTPPTPAAGRERPAPPATTAPPALPATTATEPDVTADETP